VRGFVFVAINSELKPWEIDAWRMSRNYFKPQKSSGRAA